MPIGSILNQLHVDFGASTHHRIAVKKFACVKSSRLSLVNPQSFGSLYKSSFYWIKAQFLAIFWINVELVQSLDQIPIRLSFVGSSSIFLTIFCDELPILPCFSRGLAPHLVARGHCLGTAFANASNLYETGP